MSLLRKIVCVVLVLPESKLVRIIPAKKKTTTSKPLELLHLDLFGPSHYDTLCGGKFKLVIVDDFTRYTWVFLLKSKDETYKVFVPFARKFNALMKR